MKKKKIAVVGAGIGALAGSSILAKNGYDVTVYEKNDKAGGRINFFSEKGFTFDMGPSWYWMPEVFEDFYNKFDHTTSDFYDLKRLDPSYQVIFPDQEIIRLPASYEELLNLFESHEKGSAKKLKKFLSQAKYKYEVGMSEFVWKPSQSIFEFADIKVLKSLGSLHLFRSISKEISKVVNSPKLRQILEFPVLFLGATAKDTPALYSLMNYADINLGTWYPMGGMYKIADAFTKIANSSGVNFRFNSAVEKFEYSKSKITKVITKEESFNCDYVLANADYHHVDQQIIDKNKRNYSEKYWDSRKLAPSSILIYLGVNKKIDNLLHHNLYFDTEFDTHATQIYSIPEWPSDPLFYVCSPSVTDESVAPSNQENLFILIPIATNLDEKQISYEYYLNNTVARIEKSTGQKFKEAIVFKRFFGVEDFKKTYNSFKGNAYGLANTIMQTAILKPSLKSKKITNLYYAGQLTTPGPGLPPSIISGQVAANQLIADEL